MRCVVIDGSGQVVESTDTPCTGFYLLTPAEAELATTNPFHLSPEDGFYVASAILAVWAAAWAWRSLIAALDADASLTHIEGS